MAKDGTGDLTMPRLGETMDEGTIVAWLVKPGESYSRGNILAEVETDKTIVELPALADGELAEIVAGPGSKVAVGGLIARVVGSGAAGGAKVKAAKKPARKKKPAATKPAKAPPRRKEDRGIPASPNARRVARELGVDLAGVSPTGRRGRMTAADVERAAAGGKAGAGRKGRGDSGIALYHWPGDGPADDVPLLLIHGLFGNAAAWGGVAAALNASGRSVYAVDLPGHGKSRSALTGAAEIAQEVLATVRDSHGGPIRVAGLSFGAIVATEIASSHGECVELLLICPAGLGRTSNAAFVEGMLAAAREADGALLDERLSEHGVSLGKKAIDRSIAEMSANARQLERIARAAFPWGGQAHDISDALSSLEIPARALFALEDKVVPWQDAANLPMNVPAHFLSGVGHLAHMEALDRVVEFLSAGS